MFQVYLYTENDPFSSYSSKYFLYNGVLQNPRTLCPY